MTPLPRSFLLLPPKSERGYAIVQKKAALLTIKKLLAIRAKSKDEARSLNKLKTALTNGLKTRPAAIMTAIKMPEIATPIHVSNCEAIRLHTALIQLIHSLQISGEWIFDFDALRLDQKGKILLFNSPANGYRSTSGNIEILHKENWIKLSEITRIENVKLIDIHPLEGDLELALWDANPLFQVEAHPDKDGNAIDLGEREPTMWIQAINDALGLIKASLPEWWMEFPRALKRIVPVGHDSERHNSASYAEALGIAYISLHPSILTMAEAIVHETQHNKINALLQLEPVLYNGASCWTSSPVRPDLRPLNGVLLAAHAFVPVSAMHLRLWKQRSPIAQGPDFHKRRISVIESNQKAIDTLKEKSDPSPKGRAVLHGLYALHNAICAASEESQSHNQ